MKAKNFETATRTSAVEIMSTVAEEMPSLLRKQAEGLREHLFPSLFHMIAEADFADDEEGWLEEETTEDIAKNDVSSVAKVALDRITSQLGEKQSMACMQVLIQGAIQ